MPQPAIFIPLDGRLTSLEPLTIPLIGSEVIEIVSPGNAETGNNFQVTIETLATYFNSIPLSAATVIVAGATISSPYNMLITDTRLLFNKTIASASYVVAPLAASIIPQHSILIKDFRGNADAFPIQISFTGGELCDGLSTITLANPYAWVTITPAPSGGRWYMS